MSDGRRSGFYSTRDTTVRSTAPRGRLARNEGASVRCWPACSAPTACRGDAAPWSHGSTSDALRACGRRPRQPSWAPPTSTADGSVDSLRQWAKRQSDSRPRQTRTPPDRPLPRASQHHQTTHPRPSHSRLPPPAVRCPPDPRTTRRERPAPEPAAFPRAPLTPLLTTWAPAGSDAGAGERWLQPIELRLSSEPGRYSQPSPGAQVGDVGNRRAGRAPTPGTRARRGPGRRGRRARGSSFSRAGAAAAGQTGRPHQPFDALSPEALAIGHDELGVDPRAAVDAAVSPVNLADALEQPLVFDGPRRRVRAAQA